MSAEWTTPETHISELLDVLPSLNMRLLDRWGRHLSKVLSAGHRLLVAGNGGSAAQAAHLAAELVGRFQSDRSPLSVISLASGSAVVSALGNDFGFDQVFSRQVQAHGRNGDVLLLLSTSGRSQNLLHAGSCGKRLGLLTWAITGPTPNDLADLVDESFCVESLSAQSVQECQLVAIHVLCASVDEALAGEQATSGNRVISGGSVDKQAATHQVAKRALTRPGRPGHPKGLLVVAGDAFLDRDITGYAHRLSPEAAIPVVDSAETLDRPGGAALAALLGARRPADVALVTCLGQDLHADQLRTILHAAGVQLIDLGTLSPTMVKTRVRAAGRTLIRYDIGARSSQPTALTPEARHALESAGAILVADYSRGMTANEQVRAALAAEASRVSVVWDPHPRGRPPVPGTCLVTPSRTDAYELAPGTLEEGLAADVLRARQLRQAWSVRHVCVTRGAEGAILVDSDNGPPVIFPAPPLAAVDTRGAGDQFAVTVAYWLGCGALPSQAVNAAVAEATDYLRSGGVLTAHSQENHPPAHDCGAALEIARQVRDAGGTVVAAGGCFDLLHVGHVTLLEQARSLGDCLIVCLNSDASVKRIKGPDRPVVPAADRARILAALAAVDAVVQFDEETPAQVLAMLRPHLYVKGGDYGIGDISECDVVEAGGGHVVLLPYVDGRSTSGLMDNVIRRHAGSGLMG